MKLTEIFKEKETASTRRKIGKEEISIAAEVLRDYKNSKSALEARIIEDEQWWKLRHWETFSKEQDKGKHLRRLP